MRWLGSVVLFFALVLGCATTSHDVLPPEQDVLPPELAAVQDRPALDQIYLQMLAKDTKKNSQWWVQYRRASLWRADDPGLACTHWAALGVEPHFPLRELALIRAYATCSQLHPPPILPQLEPNPKPWLAAEGLKALLIQAQYQKNWFKEFELLIEQSKLAIDPDLKLELVEQALELAEKNKDSERRQSARERREKIAPRFLESPKPSEWMIVAHDFRRARDFKSARRWFERAAHHRPLDESRRLSALRGLAQVYKLERNREQQISTLKKIVQLTKPKRTKRSRTKGSWRPHYEALVTLARAQWTQGDVNEARNVLEKSIITFANRVPRTELFWLLGRMQEEKQNFAKAVAYFEQAAGELSGLSEMKEKVAWYLGWNQRKLKNWSAAIAAFSQGRDQSLNEFSKTRFLYWMARTEKESGADSSVFTPHYDELIQTDPLGYYGLLAHRDLGRTIQRTTAIRKVPLEPSRIKTILDQPKLEWLISLEEGEVAQLFLDQASETLRRNPGEHDNESTWTDLFRSYARAGAFQHLYERLGRIPPDQRQSILAQHPDLLFPQPYRDFVTAAADRYQLPSELLFSVMRQESSFNPRARSPADAFGLMQLLPEVAQAAAQKAEIPFDRAEDLYEPRVNIPLGAYHLRQLWDRFSGRFILAVASYNASEDSIRNWMKVRYQGDPIAFVEDIPYEETRGYIRLVLRNMIFYQLLNSPQGKIDFPEWTLRLSANDSP